MTRIPSLHASAPASTELQTITVQRSSLFTSLKNFFHKRSGIPPDEAFAQVLRVVLATRTEFAFLLGQKTKIHVGGLEEDRDTETLTRSEVGSDHTLEAQLLLETDVTKPSNGTKLCIHLASQSVRIHFSPSHIPKSFAKDLLRLFISLLSGRSSAEYSQLSILNPVPTTIPSSQSALLHARFLQQARLNPDHIAVEYLQDDDTRQTLSYVELDARSRTVASYLQTALSSGENIVPFLIQPSLELYIAYVAILRAGYAFCPLPSLDSAPVSRLQELIADVSAKVVIGTGVRPQWLDLRIGWLDMSAHTASSTSDAPAVDEEVDPDRLAYVLFTSGSTGKPKGVQITHRAASTSIFGHLSTRPIPQDARWYQFAAPTFDPSVMEIFCTLSSGATLLASSRTNFLTNPERVLGLMEADHMMATPSMASMLKVERIQSHRVEALSEFRFELWTMGEKLDDRVIKEFSHPDAGLNLFNAYGPTEASINVTLRAHPLGESGSRLGPPISTASMVILHQKDNKIMPRGWPGELGLSGDQLARGYLNMPEQTSKVFVTIPGIGRVYRTGDFARLVPGREGGEWFEVEYLGRMNAGEQVKLSGRRVELSEIDAVLSRVPGVLSVSVAVVKGERLLALFVPEDQSRDMIQDLEREAELRLPSHMRPVAYYPATEIPRTTSGKKDRKGVARVLEERDASNGSLVQNGAEVKNVKLRRLISETADLPPSAVTATSSLLRLGIDSLRAVRLLTLIRRELGVDLGIEDILMSRSVGDLAERVEGGNDGSIIKERAEQFAREIDLFRQANASLGSGADATNVYPATPMQSGVLGLFLRLGKRSTGYINHSVYTLDQGKVDSDKLREAWLDVVKRNEMLRAKFVLVESGSAPFAVVISPDSTGQWVEVFEKDRDTEALISEYLSEAPERIKLESPWVAGVIEGRNGKRSWVLSLHHALFDGASLALLLQDLQVTYSYLSGHGPKDVLHREGLELSVMDALTTDQSGSLKHWENVLKGYTPDPFPDLTGLRSRAKEASNEFTLTRSPTHHVSTITSTHTTYSSIVSKAKTLQTSPLAIVQAAWASLLLCYSSEQEDGKDVVFGSVIGGRTTEALERTAAPLFTAVPIRFSTTSSSGINASRSLGAVLEELTSANATALKYRYPPTSVLTRGGRGGGIIYDTTIALQTFSQGTSQTDLWTDAAYPPMTTEFAAVLELWPEEGDTLRFRMTSSNQVLTPASSTAVIQQFDDILHTILSCSSPDTTAFDAMLDGVRTELQSSVNSSLTAVELPDVKQRLIHQGFEENARNKPDQIAIWFKNDLSRPETDIKWTYRELDRKANRLANLLLKLYGKDGLLDKAVPLCMRKCPELYVAILGVVKAGAAWCPVDDSSPALRKKDLFARAGGPVVLVQDRQSLDSMRDSIGNVEGFSFLSLDDNRLDSESDVMPDVEHVSSSNLAYLIWTSGTTGAPKGVPIEHAAAVQSLNSLQEVIPSGKEPVRCLNFSAYTFDVSVLDVFYTLGKCCGTLCCSTKDILVGRFVEVANSFNATHAFLTPAFMAQESISQTPSLRSIISIGEKLPDSVADKWCRPDCVSLNTYGPAESTIIATYRRFQPGEKTKAHNVGFPIQTVSCFAVKDGRILPRGAAGELALGGFQNARGYHGRADITAKKFVEYPGTGKVYLTGDIVRFLHDGSCEFVGRNDDLVKLGGIRVELSEISSVLSSCHQSIEEISTMLLARTDRPQKVICTFLSAPTIPLSNGEVNFCTNEEAIDIAAAAKTRSAAALPAFMRPDVFIIVKRLPHTASNKIDRKALNEYYEAIDIHSWEKNLETLDDITQDDEWNEIELVIQRIVSDLSGTPVERVSKGTQLSALGIDSIRSLQLASRLRNAGLDITAADVLSHPSIALISKLLGTRKSVGSVESSSVLNKSDFIREFETRWRPIINNDLDQVERVLPCTPLQDGMIGQTIQNPNSYWSHRLFSLEAGCDVERLVDAWTAMAATTEALRTVFLPTAAYSQTKREGDSVFLQGILSQAEVHSTKKTIKASQLDEASREYARLISSSLAKSSKPFWSVTMFTTLESRNYMMLSMHHALYDGDAMVLLLEGLLSAYNREALPSRMQMTEALSSAFFSFEHKDDPLEFWEKTLQPFANPSALPWPTLLSTSIASRKDSGFITNSFSIDRAHISTLASELNVSASHFLQAGWATVMSAYLGTSKVIFGETRSARLGSVALETSIAPLIMTIPIAVELTSEITVRRLVQRLGELSAQSMGHNLVSLQHVRRVLKTPMGQPVFPAIFVMNAGNGSAESEILSTSDLWAESKEILDLGVEHPVAVNVYVGETSIVVKVSVNSQLASPDQAELLTSQYQNIILTMLNSLDTPMGLLSNSLDERLMSISESPEPANVNPRSPSEWLESLADSHPTSLAIGVYDGKDEATVTHLEWSYIELEEAANRVADALANLCPEARVIACCLPRSREALAHQIGIFKAGKTYFPISTEIPGTRKRFLCRKGGADVVLTTKESFSDFDGIHASESMKVISVDSESYKTALENADPVRKRRQPPQVSCILCSSTSSGYLTAISSERLSGTIQAFADQLPVSNSPRSFLAWLPASEPLHILELLLPLCIGIPAVSMASLAMLDVGSALKVTKATHSFLSAASLEREGMRPKDVPCLQCPIMIDQFMGADMQQSWTGESMLVLRKISVIGSPSLEFALGSYLAYSINNVGTAICAKSVKIVDSTTGNPVLRGQRGNLLFSSPYNVQESSDVGLQARLMVDNTLELYGSSSTILRMGTEIDLRKAAKLVKSLVPQNLRIDMEFLEHPQGVQPYLVAFISRTGVFDPLDASIPEILSKDASLARTLHGLCHSRLPAYMAPDFVIPLSFTPVVNSLSTKVDSSRLRHLFYAHAPSSLAQQGEFNSRGSRALTNTEEQISRILSNVSGVRPDAMNPSTTTLEIGIDSLNAITLSFQLKAAGFFVPPHVVLTGPSIEKLAKASAPTSTNNSEPDAMSPLNINERTWRQARDSVSGDIEAILPCLPLQEGLIAHTLISEQPLYVNHFIFELQGADAEKLRSAVNSTIESNSILRTCFLTGGKDIYQVILKEAKIDWKTLEVPPDQDIIPFIHGEFPSIEKEVTDELGVQPPIRCSLYTFRNVVYWCLTLHHSIYDGESLSMMLKEVQDRYNSKYVPARPSVEKLLEHLALQSRELSRSFFVDYLQGIPDIPPPTAAISGSSQHRSVTLDVPLSDLERNSRALNSNLHVLALTAFGAALGELRKENDVVFGLVLSGRTLLLDGIDQILAPCITTTPIRVNRNGNALFPDLTAQIQHEFPTVMEHQHTPLRLVQKWLGSADLFDVLFNFTRRPSKKPGHDLWRQTDSRAVLDYPFALAVEIDAENDTVSIRTGHYPDFASAAAVSSLVDRMVSLMSNPQQEIQLDQGSTNKNVESKSTVYDESKWSSEELLIRKTVAELCDIDASLVSKDTSFLQIGVDSITSIRLAQKLRDDKLDVPTYAIMRNPCIGALSSFLADLKLENTVSVTAETEFSELRSSLTQESMGSIPLLSADDKIITVYPATALQIGMLTQTVSSNGQLYVVSHAMDLDTSISESKLRASWEKVIAENDILRCSFHITSNSEHPWVCAIHQINPIHWEEHAHDSEEELHAEAKRIEADCSLVDEKAFEKPPILFHLLRSPSKRVLVIVIHHCLYDGTSLPYMFQDVEAHYAELEVAPRPQFTDAAPYIIYGAKDERDFWKKRLSGFLPSPLKRLDRGRDDQTHLSRTTLELSDHGLELIRSMNVTVHAVALLAWGKTLASLAGSLDVAFGQVVSGRSIPLENALQASGPLFNTIPFRFHIRDVTWSNKEAVQHIQALNVEAEPHQHVPLRKIQREWRKEVANSNALFDTLFVFQHASNRSTSSSRPWKPYVISTDASSAQYNLNIEIVHAGNRIDLRAGCSGGIMEKHQVENILKQLHDTILNIVNTPNDCVMNVPASLSHVQARGYSQRPQQRKEPMLDREFSESETILRQVISQVAKVKENKITLTTPLYALGVDSVAAIQIAAKCRQCGLDIVVADLFAGETIAGICAAAEQDRKKDTQASFEVRDLVSSSALERVLKTLERAADDVEDVLPILAGQHYHLNAWLASGKTFYQPVFAYKSRKALDPLKLASSWQRLRSQHAILRSVFTALGPSEAYQTILRPEVDDCPSLEFAEKQGDFDEIVQKHVRQEYHKASDLFNPPSRVKHLRVNGTDVLLLVLHHVTYDAWSVPLLVADLCRLYEGQGMRSTSNFPDFVRHMGLHSDKEKEKAYWIKSLTKNGSAMPTLLPTRNVSAGRRQKFSRLSEVVLDTDKLQFRCQSSGFSLQALVLAAWARAVKSSTGADDALVVGVYHTGRAASFEGLDILAGPCVNILPMRLPIAVEGGISEAAKDIQADLGRRTAFEQSYLHEILPWVGQTKGPLFNIYINLLWHGDKIRTIRQDSLLESLSIGVPTKFSPDTPIEIETAVDQLDNSYLSELALYIDVVLNAQTSTISLAVRCHEALLDASALEDIMSRFKEEMSIAVQEL